MLDRISRITAVSCLFALPVCAQLRPVTALETLAPRGQTLLQSAKTVSVKSDDSSNPRRAPLLSPFASLLVPGTGQALMQQPRSVGYLVIEGFLVLQAVRAQHDVNVSKAHFRSIAANVARASFANDRPPGPWEYYETLEEFSASGAYDLGGAKFSPETDETTYNGLKWLQARQTYWNDARVTPAETSPEYQKAIGFYKSHAVQGSFRWSWRDHQLEQSEYIQTIKEANSSKQRFVSEFGLIAANHLISMIDAYINVRLRRTGAAGLGLTMNADLRPVGDPILRQYGSALRFTLALPH